jgi:hypothetical protein
VKVWTELIWLMNRCVGKWAFENMVKKFEVPHLGDRTGITLTKQ